MKLSAVLALAALALTPSLHAQTTTLFSDGFDSGLAQWTATGLWHAAAESGNCSTQVAPFPSGGTAAAFNNDGIGQTTCGFYTSLAGNLTTTLPISIPADAVNARLRFMTYEETECGGPNCGWDERYVRVSTDGGANWTAVMIGDYESVWYERYVSLDAYVGMDVLIQFRFEPVDTLWNGFPGWFIDDVSVEIDSPFAFYCKGKLSSVWCIPAVDAAGDISLSGPDDLVVSARFLRNNVSSKLIWSRGANNQPWGGGTLCVQAPAARTTVRSSFGTPAPATDCTGTYAFTFTHAYLGSKSVLAGETLYVQCSTRDPGYSPPNNHSLSNALSFTVLP